MDNLKIMILILGVAVLILIVLSTWFWAKIETLEDANKTGADNYWEIRKLKNTTTLLLQRERERTSEYPVGDYCQKCKAVVATEDDTRFCQHDLPCKNFEKKVTILDVLNGNTGISKEKEGEDE